MATPRIRIILPKELEDELNNIGGFEIKSIEEVPGTIQDYQMNLSDIINPNTLAATAHASIALIGFLSNINGVVTLIEKIHGFFVKNPKSGKKIQIMTSTKQITIKEDSSPEVYAELTQLLEKLASK